MKTFYNRNIIEGRVLTIVVLLFFITSRIIIAFFGDIDYHVEGGLLWQPISKLITSLEVSVLLSSASAIGIAIYLAHINNQFALIRRRSPLPLAFILLIFNAAPEFMIMSPYYIGMLFFLIALKSLLESYQSFSSAQYGAAVGFSLALGSLFVPEMICLWVLFMIGFSIMRSSNFRTILASVLAVSMVGFLSFSFFYATDQLDTFFSLLNEEISAIFVLNMNVNQIITLSVTAIILITTMVNYYMNHFKDKIRIRASISCFHLIGVGSLVIFLFSPIHAISEAVLFPLLGVTAFLLAHFFAVAESKWKIYFFYILMSIYIGLYVWNIVL